MLNSSGVVNTEKSYPVVLYTEIREGYVQEAITATEKGWIKFSGSYWAAKFYHPSSAEAIAPGETVKVIGRQGNTLLVVPVQQPTVLPFISQTQRGHLQAA